MQRTVIDRCNEMSDQQSDDQKTENKKRKRPSEEVEGMEMQVEEPPKKQSRRGCQASTPAPLQSDTSQPQKEQVQPPYLETSDMEAIRSERRSNAYRTIDVVLPPLIARLRAVHRRAKAAADERRCSGVGQQGSTGPCVAPKKRQLVKQLKKLLDEATELLRQHHEQRKASESAYESQLKSSADRLQQLASEALLLTERHREIHHANNNDEEEIQKSGLEQLRLIISHPLFYQIEEDPLQGVDDAPADDPQDPLHDTAELMDLVTEEMWNMLQCSHSLKQWISLYEPPPQVATSHEINIRAKGLSIIAKLVRFCEINLASCNEYSATRFTLEQNAIKDPLSFDRMKALDSYDSVMGVVWRLYASDLADHCERLIDFVNKHIRVLEQPRPDESAANYLYS